MKTCKTCRWVKERMTTPMPSSDWFGRARTPRFATYLTCQRNPPSTVGFPITGENEFCGQWESEAPQ